MPVPRRPHPFEVAEIAIAEDLPQAREEGFAACNVHSRLGIDPDDYRPVAEKVWPPTT